MDRQGRLAILGVINFERQNVDDQAKVDVWLAGFLASIADAQQVSGDAMAEQMRHYFGLCRKKS